MSGRIAAALLEKKEEEDIEQPSAYLCARCPLCFGGDNWQRERSGDPMYVLSIALFIICLIQCYRIDCIVCIDACFTQKRSQNPRGMEGNDPSNPTESCFISPENVSKMEAYVEQCRSRGRGRQRHQPSVGADLEHGMQVPLSVLDGCRESFKAADERREKASIHID